MVRGLKRWEAGGKWCRENGAVDLGDKGFGVLQIKIPIGGFPIVGFLLLFIQYYTSLYKKKIPMNNPSKVRLRMASVF